MATAFRVRQIAGQQQPQILFPGKHCFRSIVGSGRYNNFGKNLGNRFGCCSIERAVDRNDSAKGRNAVAFECGAICFDQTVRARHATRVGVLDDHDCRRAVAKLADKFERGVGVVVIIVTQLFSLHLFGLCYA